MAAEDVVGYLGLILVNELFVSSIMDAASSTDLTVLLLLIVAMLPTYDI